jgi:CubicO group peptidase (beta-lactamase class C family)
MKMKQKKLARVFIVFTLVLSLTACTQAAVKIPTNTGASQPQNIDDILQPYLGKYDLPSISAVVITNSQIIAQGAVGERKSGDATPVTINDQYLLGSCTKAMTATIIAMLVQEGKLNWTGTMGDIFPAMKAEMLPKYRDVTILELLSHHAGLPGNGTIIGYCPTGTTIEYWQGLNEPIMQQRYEYTKDYLCQPDSVAVEALPAPGTTFLYSNVGYVIAAAAAEHVTGKSWEDLMTAMLFKPLGMTTAGFGPMASGVEVNEPWQSEYINGQILSLPPDSISLVPVLFPAGFVHLSVPDWAKFITMQLEGENGGSTLLGADNFKILHTAPFNDGYALGWFVQPYYLWTGGKILSHGGDTTTDHADVWMVVSAKSNFAVLVTTNINDPANKAEMNLENLINILRSKFVPPQ